MQTEAHDATDAPAGTPPADCLREHPRRWRDNLYVYPVISRRSHGLSLGINLNLDEACNFNCVYCQVRRGERDTRPRVSVDLGVMQNELEGLLDEVQSGAFWTQSPFDGVEPEFRRLDNLAFAGNGEPTLCRWFEQAVAVAAAAKVSRNMDALKLVLMTNASLLRDPGVEYGLRLMAHYQGEIWAKLDAGSESLFAATNRAAIPFSRILDNLRDAGRRHDLVLQSLWMRRHGEGVDPRDFDEYLECIRGLRADGCRLRRVQLYTVARAPAEAWVTPLADAELDELGARFRQALPDLPVEIHYG